MENVITWQFNACVNQQLVMTNGTFVRILLQILLSDSGESESISGAEGITYFWVKLQLSWIMLAKFRV